MIESYIPKFLSCLYHERIKDVIPGQELIDMFHGNQINSAYEMLKACEHLREHRILYSYIDTDFSSNALYIGSWMGFKTKLLCDFYDYSIVELELDPRCKDVSEIWNEDNKNYKGHIQGDANKMDDDFYKQFNLIINPSCEHMSDDWYYKLQPGTFVLLQSNDFDIPQHTNIVKNTQEMIKKYEMKNIYSCTMQCTAYQRFTLAGIKT